MQTKRCPLVPALCAGMVLLFAAPAAANPEPIEVSVPVSGSVHIELKSDIHRISTGSADIVDVKAFDPNQLLLTGRRAGVTTTTVWTRKGVQLIKITVTYPNEAIRDALRQAIPDGKRIDVKSAGSTLLLSGQVPSVEDVARAEMLAAGIVAGTVGGGGAVPIVNMLTVPGNQQVQLEVSFAEVSRSSLREIGFNFWSKKAYSSSGYAGGMTSPSTGLDGLSPELSSAPDIADLNHGVVGFDPDTGAPLTNTVPLVGNPVSGAFGFIFSSTLGGFPFSAALSLLSSRGYARTLAEPSLVALSGKSASFLAGGEFPVPLPQSLGQIAVEYRKFGIQLEFTPTVIGDDIQLDLSMTVSDIDYSIGVKLASTTVPGLTERFSSSTVRLKDGESFVIAGLLSDKVRSNVDKVPWLGDVPVLGVLFRSSSYRRDETELLVVVTAHRVGPLSERPTLPGEHATTDPSDLELFLLGKYESIDTEDDEPQPKRRKRREKRAPVGAVGFKR